MSDESQQVPESERYEERITKPFTLLGLLWVVLAVVSQAAPTIRDGAVRLRGGDILIGNAWFSIPLFGMTIIGVAAFVLGFRMWSCGGMIFGIVGSLFPLAVWYMAYSFSLF